MHYGVILNDTGSLARIGPLDEAPYKGAPKAPVLYLKPANTLASADAPILLPEGAATLEIGATVGLVIAAPAARLDPARALDAVGEIVLLCDLARPHASVHRPAIRERCFDGSLVVGPTGSVAALAGLELVTSVDGVEVDRFALADLVRPPARLLADVTEFMTLVPGDVLMVGVRHRAPEAGAGATIAIEAEGLGRLAFTLSEDRA